MIFNISTWFRVARESYVWKQCERCPRYNEFSRKISWLYIYIYIYSAKDEEALKLASSFRSLSLGLFYLYPRDWPDFLLPSYLTLHPREYILVHRPPSTFRVNEGFRAERGLGQVSWIFHVFRCKFIASYEKDENWFATSSRRFIVASFILAIPPRRWYTKRVKQERETVDEITSFERHTILYYVVLSIQNVYPDLHKTS